MKKLLTLLCTVAITINLVACGQPDANEGTGSIINSPESKALQEKEETLQEKEEISQQKEDDTDQEELSNWKGMKDHFGYTVDFSENSISIDLEYPSLKPTSYGWAYQKDATYIGVLAPGYDEDYNDLEVDALENTFAAAKTYFCQKLDSDRNKHYDNFDFTIETEEPIVINEFSMYKYTGTHTYTYDKEERECYFVAYSVDTGQIEHSFPTIIVMDDTLSHPNMDPVSKETVEAYARKMAESVKITKH